MHTSDNLLLHLHRWARLQDENFTTEAFCHLLRHLLEQAPDAADHLLRRLTGLEATPEQSLWTDAVVDTQFRTAFGIPDIRIESPEALVLVEVKVESELSEGQAEGYLQFLGTIPESSKQKKLAVLTRYRAPDSLPDEVHQVRWIEIAEELDEIKEGELSETSHHLVEQFLEFLRQRGMAPLQVRSGLSASLNRYQERMGEQSIFIRSRIGDLSRITDEEDLRPLYDLLCAMEAALEQTNLFGRDFKLGSGQQEDGWIGYNMQQMQYFFYVRLNAPEVLVFEAFNAPVDPSRHDDSTGTLYRSYGDWRWNQQLDLASDDVDFFSRPKTEQQSILVEFIEDSHAIAQTLE